MSDSTPDPIPYLWKLDSLATTPRRDVLSMIACRYDYGHWSHPLDAFFWDLLNQELPAGEIEAYARELADSVGYSEEDYVEAVENLTEWKAAMLAVPSEETT